jgi:hypothetical protein
MDLKAVTIQVNQAHSRGRDGSSRIRIGRSDAAANEWLWFSSNGFPSPQPPKELPLGPKLRLKRTRFPADITV